MALRELEKKADGGIEGRRLDTRLQGTLLFLVGS
jgi:hypothetical protein